MPAAARRPRRTMSGGEIAGGTAVGGTAPAVWLGVLAVAIVLGVAVFMIARKGDSAAAGVDGDGGVAEVGELGGGTDDGAGDSDEGGDGDEGDDEASDDPAEVALGDFDILLRDRRLWAEVSRDSDEPSIVRLSSQFCGDDGLLAALEESEALLKQGGFTGVHCYSPHGRLVFDQRIE
jgi:hypothetical protein